MNIHEKNEFDNYFSISNRKYFVHALLILGEDPEIMRGKPDQEAYTLC